ncbi:MAG: hypothetical protein ABSA39_03045 [Edaphobacter sp.]
MKIFCIATIALFGLVGTSGCKRKAPLAESAAVATRVPVEADFSSAPYAPAEKGSASFLIEQADFSHNGTGQQGLLLETQKSDLDVDPLNAPVTGYHYFLYNPHVHISANGSTKCDLEEMVRASPSQNFKIIMTNVNGEGFITDEHIGLEGEGMTGYYPVGGCDFLITGVHTSGVIPDDVWSRSNAMWQRNEPIAVATRAKEKADSEKYQKQEAEELERLSKVPD